MRDCDDSTLALTLFCQGQVGETVDWPIFDITNKWFGPFYDVVGRFELRYVRDKDKREVDFVVVRDRQPWFLVEVKLSEDRLHPHLGHFQAQTGAAHAFQVVWNMPFVRADPFNQTDPVVVPAQTFLAQLL